MFSPSFLGLVVAIYGHTHYTHTHTHTLSDTVTPDTDTHWRYRENPTFSSNGPSSLSRSTFKDKCKHLDI